MTSDPIALGTASRSSGLRPLRADPAVRILLVATLLCAPLVALAMAAPAADRPLWDNLHWSVSAVGAALAVAWSIRGTSRRVRAVRAWAAVGFALWMLATLAWAWMNLISTPTVPSIADVLIASILIPGLGLLVVAIRGRLSPAEEAAVLLDGALGLVLVGAVVVYAFGPTTLATDSAAGVAALAYPTGFLSMALAGFVTVLSVGYPIGWRGSVPLASGAAMVGLAYLSWIGPMMSLSDPGELSSLLFTVGTLVAAYGAVTWRGERSRSERYLAFARTASRIIGPLLASLLFLLILLPAPGSIGDMVHVLVFSGAILVLVRQGLIVRERTAMLAQVTALTRSNQWLVAELRRDLEERTRQEERKIRAERADAIGTLSSNVGHEVNNPLTGVLGYAELLLAELPARDAVRSDVEKIREEALRARSIVGGLRELANPRPVRPQLMDLCAVLEYAVGAARPDAARKGASVDLECEARHPIEADPAAIERVMGRLLDNAIRATEVSGAVRVKARVDADCVVISVADDGIGMDARTLRQASEPLFSNWPPAMGPSRGLGLTVSEGLISAHGGTIAIDSAPGRGTTVEIRLPVAGVEAGFGARQEVQAT